MTEWPEGAQARLQPVIRMRDVNRWIGDYRLVIAYRRRGLIGYELYTELWQAKR